MTLRGGDAAHLLRFTNVAKRFGAQVALRSVDCSFSAGEIVLLLGANGAGKSTLLKLGAGLLRADAGSIEKSVERPGYVGHDPMLYAELTVEENLNFFSALYPNESHPSHLLSAWGLASQRNKKISELSRGMQLRTSLVRTLLSDPALLLLDEPTSALDDEGVELLSSTIRACANIEGRAGTVIIATHDVERLRRIATRIVLLTQGKVEKDSKSCEEVISVYRQRNR